MHISSPAFVQGSEIPAYYTCEGENVSPPIQWKDIPPHTKSLTLIVDDPDAPDPKAPKIVWVHWIMYNIHPTLKGLDQNAQLPEGAKLGINNWNKTNYGGPCPPIGRHRYYHRLYALDIMLPDLQSPTKEALLEAMKGHILAQAELMGTYQKQGK